MLKFGKTDSGYKVYHYRLKNSSTCQVQFVVNCGSSHEDLDSWGVAHFLEHMSFQGTDKKDKHQINREQSLIGNFNASTGLFQTHYYFEALNDDFVKSLELLKEIVFDSCYPDHEIEKERKVILEEWRMTQSYQKMFSFITQKLYGDQEGHPIIGTEKSINEITTKKIKRFRDKFYGKDNISIIVVGDLKFKFVIDQLNRLLPVSADCEKSIVTFSELKMQYGSKAIFWEDTPQNQSAYTLVGPWPNPKENFENHYLGGFYKYLLSKYLYENLRDNSGLCYSVDTYFLKNFDNCDHFITVKTNEKNLKTCELETKKLFDNLKNENGIPDLLLKISKKKVLFNHMVGLDSINGISSLISLGATFTSEKDWFENNWMKFLDSTYLTNASKKITKKKLADFSNEYMNDFISFLMKPKKQKRS